MSDKKNNEEIFFREGSTDLYEMEKLLEGVAGIPANILREDPEKVTQADIGKFLETFDVGRETFLGDRPLSYSALQDSYQEYQDNTNQFIKSGLTAGGNALQRRQKWTSLDAEQGARITFVPCDAQGKPRSNDRSSEEEMNARYGSLIELAIERDLIDDITDFFSLHWAELFGSVADLLIQATQRLVFGQVFRVTVDLLVNPQDFEIGYSRAHARTNKYPAGAGKEIEGKKAELTTEETANQKNGILTYRGITDPTQWQPPQATIKINGFTGPNSEVMIARLKYIFVLFDPSFYERAKRVLMGAEKLPTDGEKKLSAMYVPTPGTANLYLWELHYRPVYFPHDEHAGGPYPGFEKPKKYLGYVSKLSFTQSFEHQREFAYSLEFVVYQPRDYNDNAKGL